MKEQIKEWLTLHKSITVPAWLKRNPKILEFINDSTKNIPDIKNVMERVYIVLYGNPEYCEYGNKRKFNTFDLGYRKGCVKGNECRCVDKYRIENQKKTLLEKYGVDATSRIPGIIEKRIKTNREKYGVDFPAQSQEIYAKMRASYQSKTPEYKEQIKENRRKTNIEKFGVDHHMKLDIQKEKVKTTNLQRYGTELPMQNEEIKSRMIETWKSLDREEIRKNTKATNIVRYGVEYYTQQHLTPKTLQIIHNSENFKNFVKDKTRQEVREELGISDTSLQIFTKRFDSHDLFAKSSFGGTSKIEEEIRDFVYSLGFDDLIHGDRKILHPRELDIYIPSIKMAIEVCGIYWHSELSSERKPDYHYSKYAQCRNQGIQLITIFDDEWIGNKEKVKNRLVHILGKSERTIFARKCVVKEITNIESSDFVSTHHLQGDSSSSVNLGLYLDGELVSVMTFGKPRFSKKYNYELIRFCSKYSVVGAAGKLMSFFTKMYNPHSIVSYSDNRWGWGTVYEKLGFQFIKNQIGYQYTDYRTRYNRMQFQKHKLVKAGHDPELTEWQIMQNLGYDRVWDCGQSTWVWTNINNVKVEI
jgi:hypothetical protein